MGGAVCISEVIDISFLILACASSSPSFHMMHFACKLTKQGTIYNLDVLLSGFGTSVEPVRFVSCAVLTVAS